MSWSSDVEDLIVLYDELAFPLGTIRIRERGSANGHNGVKSISGALGTEEWMRIRIGVGKPPRDGGEIKAGGTGLSALARCASRSWRSLDEVLDQAVRAVESCADEGVSAAMNEFNRKRSASQTERRSSP